MAEISGRNSVIEEQLHDGAGAAPLLAPDWTPEEERAAKRKLDFIIMPLLMLGFFSLQLDRGNIANALTDNFLKDVGIVQNQFNVGQQLLSLGIVLLEIPANILLYKWGPSRWLSIQIMAFGLVSTFQAFQKGYGAFLATRLLLGLTESGYIPGALFTLTTWYTRAETAKRVTVFFIGNLAASASTNLLSYGILRMRGVAGRTGWFWLFVLMGLFTIASSFFVAFFLPDSVHKPRSFFLPNRKIFTDRELHILRNRVTIDDPKKAHKKVSLGWRAIWSALSNWRIWPHVMITLLNNAPLTAFGAYAPTIIRTFGFERLRSNALASVGPWILIPVSVAFSAVSDSFNLRGWTTIAALVANLAFMITNSQLALTNARGPRFAGIVLTQSIGFTAHPLNISWMAVNTRNTDERAVAMAMMIMAANAAGIYGGQIFRSDDAPRYKRGMLVNVGLLALALAFAIFQIVQYFLTYKKKGKLAHEYEDETTSTVSDEKSVEASTEKK